MSTELILVRHGESVANVTPVIGGMTGDVGLTDRGRRQAELLAERLRAEKFEADVLYASTLPRAQQTARYVSQALGLPVLDDAELQELRPGDADGLSVGEWKSRWPGLADGMWRRPFQAFASGGESWATFLARAGAGLTELVARHPGERIVAVTHGGVIEASLALVFGLGPTTARVKFALANTGVTTWRHDPAADAAHWTLVSVNDAAHLSGLAPEGDGLSAIR
ncbi:histidine phosphatase family protein [Microlunatus soli]|uniref:Probable phosphoglycerate mutase n=1 Tax=Microlunatus soli TaxID=630515 RepID=A0A1H1QT93_9ACTN|nr:histidine phosphatase family protein [Microlunatus soli]SDS26606.1 probable phosphoglycerate mutase [Microlunatus soli]